MLCFSLLFVCVSCTQCSLCMCVFHSSWFPFRCFQAFIDTSPVYHTMNVNPLMYHLSLQGAMDTNKYHMHDGTSVQYFLFYNYGVNLDIFQFLYQETNIVCRFMWSTWFSIPHNFPKWIWTGHPYCSTCFFICFILYWEKCILVLRWDNKEQI